LPRIEGSEQLRVDRDRLWRLLNDPDTLAASIPGCRGFERDADAEHRYRTAIKVAVGAVTGVYEGTVEYVDVEEPERCTIVVAAKGDKGTIDGRGAITLAARGEGTEVGYEGEFKLTGPVAAVGQRMAPGVSRKMIVETLRNLERHGAGAQAPPESRRSSEAAPEPRRPVEPNAPSPADEPFRPFAVSPGVAFAAGCAVGAVIGGVVVALL
jgi:carbon monoxide dehydrogenase subunit G